MESPVQPCEASNPGKSGLPPASDLLQIPGQTWDFTVALAEGHYIFNVTRTRRSG
jgi:hypothetical protein